MLLRFLSRPNDAADVGLGKIDMSSLRKSMGHYKGDGVSSSTATLHRLTSLEAHMDELNERTKRMQFDGSNTRGMVARLCAQNRCNVSEYEKTYEEYLAEQEQGVGDDADSDDDDADDDEDMADEDNE